jgi:caffeoyl-CoA O-methyltransferase
MSSRTLGLSDALHAYLVEVGVHESPTMARLREETARLPNAVMQISPEQGAFMGWLVSTMGVRRALEVGTFTGYSALAVARSLPPGGTLVCCELDGGYARIAQRAWADEGVADRIDLHVAPAIETLDGLLAQGAAGTFDFAFIDADKAGYDAYYERSLELLRVGGVVAIDNVLWSGAVADPRDQEPSTQAIRALNAKIARDPRVRHAIVPIGDGLTLATKR